ncbi:MAG: type II secretion system major pseudopilin GspG [Alphaproteobacteria bacterium]|nr:type II secretion system major pseudopilin GspG [Alphaproteobacteria bacterium]
MISHTERRKRRSRRSRGYTLVELLVVITILAAIGLIAVPAYMNHLSSAKVRTAGIQIDRLGAILDTYLLDVGRYPTQDEGLEALVSAPPGVDRWAGPYLKKKESLNDPWGAAFVYRSPGQHGKYDLYSLGADGAEGGEGADADIKSW